jgi:hypothetical protein
VRIHITLIAAFALGACGKANGLGVGDGGPGSHTDGGGGLADGGHVPEDALPGCGLVTCASAHVQCGPIGDGCGGLLMCGECTAPATCGGGGMASQCGGTSGCTPRTCDSVHANCGPVSDGCGGLLLCGGCAAPLTCGGSGVPNNCGKSHGSGPDAGPACVPQTCASANANCGPIGDGCGGSLTCGSCMAPEICGGGGTPSVCGGSVDGGTPCTNLCTQQMHCMQGTTSVSGTVYAPTPPQYGMPDPLYNAAVYIPNAQVQPFPPGVACERCGALASGQPLVSAVTGPDGKFTLLNAPVGQNIPLVIQLGRWRRQVTIPTVNACVDNPLPADLTRLPRNKMEGDIPLTAMVTGNVDTLECVLRKIGIDDSEFTAPSAQGENGRVQFYLNDLIGMNRMGMQPGSGAQSPSGMAPPESALESDPTRLAQYDLVLFACEGFHHDRDPADQQRVIDYAGKGGRVFATHFSYNWLYNDAPWSGTANWNVDQQSPMADPLDGTIDQSFPKGMAFAQWVHNVGAELSPGHIGIHVSRHDLDGVIAPAQRWIFSTQPGTIQHYTFNTPVGMPPDQQCGRVIFSDFHVNDIMSASGMTYPAECTPGGLTPQEKVLEFMLFDLASCIQPDMGGGNPMCTPRTCAQAGANCGPVADGCGGLLQCGACMAGQTCGGGGIASVCGGSMCVPETCMSQQLMCGLAGDGCGNEIFCGNCPDGLICGGGGSPGVCGRGNCTPTTCAAKNAQCGFIADGCGGALDCGMCQAGHTCGANGQPNVCGIPNL